MLWDSEFRCYAGIVCSSASSPKSFLANYFPASRPWDMSLRRLRNASPQSIQVNMTPSQKHLTKRWRYRATLSSIFSPSPWRTLAIVSGPIAAISPNLNRRGMPTRGVMSSWGLRKVSLRLTWLISYSNGKPTIVWHPPTVTRPWGGCAWIRHSSNWDGRKAQSLVHVS